MVRTELAISPASAHNPAWGLHFWDQPHVISRKVSNREVNVQTWLA